MMPRYELVCIDAVDTLFRARGSVGETYATLAAQQGWYADATALESGFRRVMAATAPIDVHDATTDAAKTTAERTWWRDLVAQVMTPFDREPGFEPFFAAAFDYFATGAAWELLPGVAEALAQLRTDGRRLALVSEMDGRAHSVLEDLGLAPYFEFVVLATRSDAHKPDGSLFAVALATAQLDSKSVVHVGDDVANDVEGALRAGITPVLLDPKSRAAHPAHIARIHAWREFPALLRQLEQSGRTDG
jgi:putative hydrolase of the HAD superfamily